MNGIVPGVRLAARSRIWHTAPQNMEAMEYPRLECLRAYTIGRSAAQDHIGPWYANMAVCLECSPEVTPDVLFEALMALESEMGRNRLMEPRWGPRFIDIDLLTFGNETRATHRLTLPHPRMHQRAFVLLPLAEVAPGIVPPEIFRSLSFTSSGTMIF